MVRTFISLRKILVLFLVLVVNVFLSIVSVADASEITTNHNKINLNIKNLSMVKNSRYVLRVYNTEKTDTVIFESKDTDIVSIEKTKRCNAKLLAHSIGSTTVTAVIRQDGHIVSSLTCNVTVGPPAISIKFNKTKFNLPIGTSRRINAVLKPINMKERPKYSSSNNSIAVVSGNGTVTTLSQGKVTITATILNGQFASYTIKVKRKASAIPTTSPSLETPFPKISTKSDHGLKSPPGNSR